MNIGLVVLEQVAMGDSEVQGNLHLHRAWLVQQNEP